MLLHPRDHYEEAKASLQRLDTMCMERGPSHISLHSWSHKYGSEGILDYSSDLVDLKNQSSWVHRIEQTIVLSHQVLG